MDLVIYENDKPFILQGLQGGNFDYMEAASEVFEGDSFRLIKARSLFDELSQSYPRPRRKEDVPFRFYVASNLSMPLHGVHGFDAFPMVVRAGGMIQAFGPEVGGKGVHPETGIRQSSVKGLTRKISIIGRVLVILIFYARWPRTPMPKP